jgi:hypothetical protein
MLIAKIDGTAVLDVADAQSMFPGVSFGRAGPNADFLAENSCLPVTVWKSYASKTQKLVAVAPYIEDGQVFTIQVEAMTPEDIAAVIATEWVVIRIERDALLAACDWTQLPDTPADKVAWATYRSELRDVTNQTLPVAWPVKPD